jgi:hypothetical protein
MTDLHVRFAALRCNLAKSARVGSFSSAIRTALTYLLHRMSVRAARA